MAAQEALQPLRWRYGDVDDGNFAVRGRGVPLLVAILLVLVCFVTVCLYLRWACHRRATALPTYSASSSSSSSSAGPGAAGYLVAGLDDAAVAALPVAPYRAGGGGDAAARECGGGGGGGGGGGCSICLGEFAEGDKVRALPRCGHGFHPECVDPWLRARASCPLCRASLLPAPAAAKRPDDGGEAV
ncbi:hypothetical protein ACP4OV_019766 [Aristida adscensionis]